MQFNEQVFSRVTSALLNLSLGQLRKRNGKEKGREEERERERKKGKRRWKKENKNRREEH